MRVKNNGNNGYNFTSVLTISKRYQLYPILSTYVTYFVFIKNVSTDHCTVALLPFPLHLVASFSEVSVICYQVLQNVKGEISEVNNS